MKNRFIMISGLTLSFLLFTPVLAISQNMQPVKHPYKFFCERRLSQFSNLPISSDSVVFLGDSLIDEGRWEELFPGHKTLNRGVLADSTEHVLARLDQITKGKPSKIFLMVGTNDLKSGTKKKAILTNYRKILDSIKTQSKDTKVFVHSLLPRKAKFRGRIENINGNLRELANQFGFTFIDLYPAFLDGDGSIKDAYSNDDLHLLGGGYLKWKELIEKYVISEK